MGSSTKYLEENQGKVTQAHILEQVWKQPKTRVRKLNGLGVSSYYAAMIAYDRKGYWFNAGNKAVNWALSKERRKGWRYYDIFTGFVPPLLFE